MSYIQRLVSPKLPTALATHAHVDLPGYDLRLFNVCFVPMFSQCSCQVQIDNVHILPTEFDVPWFEEALSKALQLSPYAAGQLRCGGGRWSVG
jgi:hypothetical protein